MLTDRLQPMRLAGEFVPVPILPYYARLVERLGVRVPDWRLRLVVTPDQARAGDALQRHYDLSAGNYAVINPGAAFGAAKCWQPEGFAAVCDALRDQLGWQPVLVGAPGELDLLRRIAAGARGPVTLVDEPGTTLGSLKPLIRDAAVLVCNDTGPRHYGLAFDVPTVTIFGPTFQEWTDTHHPREIKLQARVRCGPCQLKRCPLDHACMKRITPEMVVDAVRRACDTRRLQATAP
jgi:heptosyltransferase-2